MANDPIFDIAAMVIFFQNFQDKIDPDHGRAIWSEGELSNLLDRKREIAPSIAEFSGAGDFHLTVGIGGDFGCIQCSRMDDNPPYLMAVSYKPPMKRGCIEFKCGGTPTPIAVRYIITFDELKRVAVDFLHSDERSKAVSWQELDQRACKEDAERPPNS